MFAIVILTKGDFGFSFEAEESAACLLEAMPVTILSFNNKTLVVRLGSRKIKRPEAVLASGGFS